MGENIVQYEENQQNSKYRTSSINDYVISALHNRAYNEGTMDEGSERDKTSRGGAYLRCPVFTTVQFSLRNEGSSENIRVCKGRESMSPNF